MSDFIYNSSACIPAEAIKLLQRIFASILLGNDDTHFKNFAMFHTRSGLRLTPAYDLVASSYYKEYKKIALKIAGEERAIEQLRPKDLAMLGQNFKASAEIILSLCKNLEKNLAPAQEAIEKSAVGSLQMRQKLIEHLEKRWNGSFASIGHYLSKKQNKDA